LISADLLIEVAARIDCAMNMADRPMGWDQTVKSILERNRPQVLEQSKKRKIELEPLENESSVKRVCVAGVPDIIPDSLTNDKIGFEFKKPIPSQLSERTTPTKQENAIKATTPNSAWFSQANRIDFGSSPFMSTGQESGIHEIYPDEIQREQEKEEFSSSLEPSDPITMLKRQAKKLAGVLEPFYEPKDSESKIVDETEPSSIESQSKSKGSTQPNSAEQVQTICTLGTKQCENDSSSVSTSSNDYDPFDQISVEEEQITTYSVQLDAFITSTDDSSGKASTVALTSDMCIIF
jgi:hypothetical protein